MRIGLALSGGGLRATLYHLGVVRYLRESGLLSSVTHITSVSGGSILGAHLVLNWDRYNGSDNELDAACREILDFVDLDVRNRILRRYPFALANGFLHRAARQGHSRRFTRTGLLEAQYRKFLFGDTCLHQLPARPELHILCTDLSEGGLSSFSQAGLLFEERSKSGHAQVKIQRAGLATVPMAVAASSAFPGFFPPLELTAEDIGATEGEFQTHFFTDGGVYDNLGVRMFRFLEGQLDSKLSVDDFHCAETAVKCWNEAAQAETSTPLSRLAQLKSGATRHRSRTNGATTTVASSQQLVGELRDLIEDANLVQDDQLRRLLHLDQFESNGPRNGNGHTRRAAVLTIKDRIARNRCIVDLAFRELTGAEVISQTNNRFDAVIASDAGKKFQVTRPDRAGSFLRTAMRSSDILMDRVWQLEKAHFEKSTDYVFLPITRVVTPDQDDAALHPEVQIQIGKIRTDMDRFSEDEVSGLVQHGYCVARQAMAARPCLSNFHCEGNPWDPTSSLSRSADQVVSSKSLRGAQATASTQQARRLQQSSRRSYLGKFFAWTDWVSYLYVPLLIAFFVLLPLAMYRNWRHGQVASSLTAAIAETRDDYKKLLSLMEFGPAEPFTGMPYTDTKRLDPLFAERGLDIIADARIVDLRSADAALSDGAKRVYVYRSVSVRKVSHSEGPTGLQLQSLWDMPAIHLRCHNPELRPKLQRYAVEDDIGSPRYAWQLELDFEQIPVGQTTNVVVEALLPVGDREVSSLGRPWWQFEVDADPEVATSWLLLPDDWQDGGAQVVRYRNDEPETLEVVDPTHHAAMSQDSILHWIVVHPKAGYTYSYRWGSLR